MLTLPRHLLYGDDEYFEVRRADDEYLEHGRWECGEWWSGRRGGRGVEEGEQMVEIIAIGSVA